MNAIILAGGRGSRLQPWHAPKCLLPINGVPMLYRLLWHLRKGADSIAVCTGYRADDVEAAIKYVDWSEMGYDFVRTSYAGAAEQVMMGERLLTARGLTDGGRVIICYGDEIADVDLKALVAKHEAEKAHLTFAVTWARMPGGTIEQSGAGEVVIVENAQRLVNIGFAVVEPQCWELLKPEDGLSDWINRVGKNAVVYLHEGKRATVNSLADLEYAEAVWK